MDLTIEAIVVASVFLIPGFVANRLVTYFSTAQQQETSPLESSLSSLVVSGSLLVLEALLASVALTILWFRYRSNFDDLQLNILVEDGLSSYFQAQPLLFASTAASAVLLSCFLAGTIGYHDLVGKVLRNRLATRGLREDDVWFLLLQREKERLGKKYTYLSVTMKKSRDVFSGRLRGYSLHPLDDGHRYLALEDIVYAPGGDMSKQQKYGGDPPGSALLSSQDIESIRVIFVGETQAPGGAIPPGS